MQGKGEFTSQDGAYGLFIKLVGKSYQLEKNPKLARRYKRAFADEIPAFPTKSAIKGFQIH